MILQVQILRLFDEATLAPRRSHKAADTSACFHRVLPALLAAAAAPDRAMRAAALDALQALPASVKAGSSQAEGTLTGMPPAVTWSQQWHCCRCLVDTCRVSCLGVYKLGFTDRGTSLQKEASASLPADMMSRERAWEVDLQ